MPNTPEVTIPKRQRFRKLPQQQPPPQQPSEVPTADEIAGRGGFEPDVEPEPTPPDPATLERPPSPTAMWAEIVQMRTKVEVLWLARSNAKKGPRPGMTTWACQAETVPGSGVKCGKTIESTAPGLPKDPPLICPEHGQSPHVPVE